MQLAANIALNHHERFDGSGYPYGLSGQEIPLMARIVAIADVFDALTSARPYKKAWSQRDASQYISQHAGSLFDPECVNVFIKQSSRVEEFVQSL